MVVAFRCGRGFRRHCDMAARMARTHRHRGESVRRGESSRRGLESNGVGLMKNRLILCVGFRGSGKSTVASAILRANDGVLVYDPHGDDAYRWIPNSARSIEELEDFSRWRREAKPKTKAAIRCIPDGRVDPFDALNDFCAWVWNWRNAWIAVEEVSEGCRSTSAQGMPPELRRLVNQGRHKLINQIYCGLRYSEIPRPVSAGADVQVIFATREPGDLDAMRQRIGSEAVESVQGLGQHEAIIFFPDRTWQVIGSRDAGIAELVLRDTTDASVSADTA